MTDITANDSANRRDAPACAAQPPRQIAEWFDFARAGAAPAPRQQEAPDA